jgi:predicted enzyme related to lactoylglutathione lyase
MKLSLKSMLALPIAGIICSAGFLASLSPSMGEAQTTGRITGVGGIFVTSRDPAKLAAWYRDVLGISIEKWGGAMLRYDAPNHPPVLVWNAMPAGSSYMAPSTREFMLDFAVDDLDAFVARLQSKGVSILKRDDTDPSGKFAWILDPDGTKIELWQSKTK